MTTTTIISDFHLQPVPGTGLRTLQTLSDLTQNPARWLSYLHFTDVETAVWIGFKLATITQ